MERIPYWNISYGLLIDLLSIPAMAVFGYGIYRHWKRIRQGKASVRQGITLDALKLGPVYVWSFLTRGIVGTRIYKKPFTGIAHGLLFWGMVLLSIGTVLVFADVLFKIPVFKGEFNHWFMGVALDGAGVAALAGVLFLLIRRLSPPERLTCFKANSGFILIEIGIIAIIITGFFIEGARIAQNGIDPGSFVGNWLGFMLPTGQGGLELHRYLWWLHGLLVLSLIAYIPFSPLAHLVLAPANAGLDTPIPGPKMGVIDFEAFEGEGEETPTLGVSKLADFSRKNLLDISTCLKCGRCHEVCPAAQTGKHLSPKGVMVTLSEYLQQGKMDDDSILDTISTDAIYSCTTCAACMEACPVSVNQPNAILSMRQHLLMERSEMPDIMGQAHRSLEARQHPFIGTGFGPNDWRKGLEVPFFEKGATEYLLWIGCSVAYEERTQHIGRAMVAILKKAGVSFGVLEENRCTGDPAKQMGNEFLFSEIAGRNIEEFNELGVTKVITMCPHCFNSFTRHYPLLGAKFEVIPHAVLIRSLIEAGKITLANSGRSICYHDPCYLGRHNNVLSEPRSVVSSIGHLVEMPRHGCESFCCGAGGGNYWTEEEGTRINQTRAKEALDTGAKTIATACPFCMLMLTDGLKKFTEEQMVQDIAELVCSQMEG
ncbi:heterodisulfide reductase-related iron-sulfur binding cluster [Geobacter grbiciae]|uniref:heterodisulfide reductase-related iron-sulfur binding cluster n=1 Tax=Geobacter grbiciae TaxID=155042 RepID=UPI001C0285FC|nr:(Fe-S)-binding protein [Geobacter grbiciae]MBT1075801.1 (Fe-S)-binding protein [Geobacter grbiciae]